MTVGCHTRPHGHEDVDSYRRALKGLSARLGVAFVSIRELSDKTLFKDPIHMNGGADVFSIEVAGILGSRSCDTVYKPMPESTSHNVDDRVGRIFVSDATRPSLLFGTTRTYQTE